MALAIYIPSRQHVTLVWDVRCVELFTRSVIKLFLKDRRGGEDTEQTSSKAFCKRNKQKLRHNDRLNWIVGDLDNKLNK